MRRSVAGLSLLMLLALVLASGCFKQPAPETKPSVVNTWGIIDMQKAIEAHPKYQELFRLQKQLNALVSQMDQQQSAMTRQAGKLADMEISAEAGIQQSLEREFQIRMAARQEEMNVRLAKSEQQFRRGLADEMQAFEDEMDKEYEPQMMNLQLKMRALQLTNEEKASFQAEYERLVKERAVRLRLQDQKLQAKLEAWLGPQKRAADQELTAFAQQLQIELDQKAKIQMKQFADHAKLPAAIADDKLPELQMQADRKQREIAGLREEILRDVRDKAAAVAISLQLDVVMANVLVNASGVDITGNVIAELKK